MGSSQDKKKVYQKPLLDNVSLFQVTGAGACCKASTCTAGLKTTGGKTASNKTTS